MSQQHQECVVEIPAKPEDVFAHLDNHSRLSGHMSKSSWMMFGSSMDMHVDDGKGQKVGSIITLEGRVLGLPLRVEEAIVERVPPVRKAWRTIGKPELLVIGTYSMGFDIKATGTNSTLRVFIDYELPASGFGHILGLLLGSVYARWCTDQMAKDAKQYFERSA